MPACHHGIPMLASLAPTRFGARMQMTWCHHGILTAFMLGETLGPANSYTLST